MHLNVDAFKGAKYVQSPYTIEMGVTRTSSHFERE